jgi:hypothetical protein
MFIKPTKPGLMVPMPGPPGRYLSAAGMTVDDRDPWWLRRITAGDVEISSPAVSTPAPAIALENPGVTATPTPTPPSTAPAPHAHEGTPT